ncbi:dihydrolipoamide succinyltransferase [Eremomyces bilateralis CBS 781.70]|uniref:dihydrolipoyllysine-residue succinyltransferase n=1 Tax=Eremomyces bilateralis CBS 781.70 TaxID=1392243 RepID=A0A6G1FXT6_9PEZI|nr:dihydrolipoamide succinyltransferase [Eremomyces bilateralis CBS 781.70]KAF1810603.1 dihydrolipoamide succinyltransferase [Eremomyces bilateralis CBS 781.70]
MLARQCLRSRPATASLRRCCEYSTTSSLPRSSFTVLRSASSLSSLSSTSRSPLSAPTFRSSRKDGVSFPSYVQMRGYAEKVVKVPEMAESITEGTLKQFSKQIGDYVELDEEIATIETDKIDVSVNAPEAGTIKKFLVNEEDTVTVGQDLLLLDAGGEKPQEDPKKEEAPAAPKAPEEPPKPKEEPTPAPPKEEPTPAPPKEETKQPSPPPPPPQQAKPTPPPQPKPKQEPKKPEPSKAAPGFGNREERRVKMNRMRLRIAERLKQSQNTAASLTTFNEVDMSSLMELRKLYKDDVLKRTGVKLGFMSAFTRACILAMKDLPAVNASIEGPSGGDTIVYRDYVDVSVAVATEKGLVTPVVRNVEEMDLVGIEKAIADLGRKARDNKLTIEDMAGGTFTISNGGVFGSLMGTPIINLPQTAVLGLHAIKEKPVAINGKVEIRPMMYLALTYDHRLLDGREAVTFLVKVKEYIEDPRRMLIA